MEGLAARVKALLGDMQAGLLAKARAFKDEHTARVASYDEFKNAMDGRPGFVIAPWCGAAECEAQIKTDTQATIRNMPFDATPPQGGCVRCDQPAAAEVWFAKSY
jgi:prolyl-tRNA synthetase